MGGIATCHLAKAVDIVIVDRSFADLDQVVQSKFNGVSALSLYKVAVYDWESSNVNSFLCELTEEKSEEVANNQVIDIQQIAPLHQTSCYKVIACDARDEMIDLQASLMVGVAWKTASH
jgi:hypothetical protein